MRTVRVTVPATTANLGPGFDSLALALGLHNVVEFSEADSGLQIRLRGEGADSLPRDVTNLVFKGAQAVFKAAGRAPSGLNILVNSEIPVASGLGSSAAALLGGVVAANAIINNPLKRDDLLKIASDIEGHPDNVIAAQLGGFVISSYDGDTLMYKSVAIQAIQTVVVLPDIELTTNAAREALPDKVALKDAAHNVGRAALVVQALIAGDYDLLGKAMRDRLHEPYRSKLIPGYAEVVKAARDAGAAAVAISGAGPALVAFAATGHEHIAKAMAKQFKEAAGKAARTWVLPVDTQGVSITEMATELPLSTKATSGKLPSAPVEAKQAEAATKPASKSAEETPPPTSKAVPDARPKPGATAPPAKLTPEADKSDTPPAKSSVKADPTLKRGGLPGSRTLKLGEDGELLRSEPQADAEDKEADAESASSKPAKIDKSEDATES